MYYQGIGVEQNYTTAFEWHEKAAMNGNIDAQLNLGCIYDQGNGVEQGYTKSVEWLGKAIEQGNTQATFLLGMYFAEGLGVNPSDKKAIHYFNIAEEGNEFPDCLFYLGFLYAYGDPKYRNEKKSRKYFNMAGERKSEVQPMTLGLMYANGCGVEQNYQEAIEFFKRDDDSDGLYYLGIMYFNGLGICERDEEEGKKYLKEAVQKDGHPHAQRLLDHLVFPLQDKWLVMQP